VEHRLLGASGIEVSALSLGSWRTFERIPRETGVEVMTAARDAGIDFLDDARYDDETGEALLPTGYSEVVFGELFRAAGWDRSAVVVANKLWWEFWPGQTAAEELDGSLERMGLDYLDLVYSEAPPEGLTVADVVIAASELIAAGKVCAWGLLNWPPALVTAAIRFASVEGLPPPCAAQLPYSIAFPQYVEDDAMSAALDAAAVPVVASATLAGGALTGKYATGEVHGRLSESLDDARRRPAFEIGARLMGLAEEWGTTPARLAITFALANSRVASVLFGATSADQVAEDVGALELLDRLGDADLATLRATADSA